MRAFLNSSQHNDQNFGRKFVLNFILLVALYIMNIVVPSGFEKI
jgi:hypothetical protein